MLTCGLFVSSCGNDYAIVAPERIVYVEVEVPVEVPVPEPEPGDVWVDHFYQSSVMDGIDIIWVIDRSGSMNQHQTRLLNGIDAMMTALPATNWRLVIISADEAYASAEQLFPLLPDEPVLTVKTYKENNYAHEAIIRTKDGVEVAKVIYRPHKPLSCGARVWIELETDEVDVELVIRDSSSVG